MLNEGYDIEIIEAHHRHKVDAPIGHRAEDGRDRRRRARTAAGGARGLRARRSHRRAPTGRRSASRRSAAATSSATTRCCSPAPASASRSRIAPPAAQSYANGSLRAARFVADTAEGAVRHVRRARVWRDERRRCGLRPLLGAGGRRDPADRLPAAGDVGRELVSDPLERLGVVARATRCARDRFVLECAVDRGGHRAAEASRCESVFVPLAAGAANAASHPAAENSLAAQIDRSELITRALRQRINEAASRLEVRADDPRLGRQHGAVRRTVRHRLGHLPRVAQHRVLGGRSRSTRSRGPLARR